MLDSIEVREIMMGVSTKEEIQETHNWVTSNYLKDQEKFGSKVVSMDVEVITASYYDLMRMSGRLPIKENQFISTMLDENISPGLETNSRKDHDRKWNFLDPNNLHQLCQEQTEGLLCEENGSST